MLHGARSLSPACQTNTSRRACRVSSGSWPTNTSSESGLFAVSMSADGDEKIESHEDGSNASSTPSSMTETDKAEVQAFLAWVGAVGVQADDLADGQALLEVLAGVCVSNRYRSLNRTSD